MATQPTLSEIATQCLSEEDIRDFIHFPQDIPAGVHEVFSEHLGWCPDCQQKLQAQNPLNVSESQLVFS